VDRDEWNGYEGKLPVDVGLPVPVKSGRLHDVFGVGVEELPGEDTLELREGLLEGGRNAMSGPEADEAGVRVDVRVKDRGVEIDLYGHGGIVARKDDAEVVGRVEAGAEGVGGDFTERGKAVDLEGEGVRIAGEPEAAGIGLLQRFEEKPLVLDSPCAHVQGPVHPSSIYLAGCG
jgi:hypothetical protein